MSTVLVTGAAGFLGSHVVEQLLKRQIPVIGIDNLSGGKWQHLAPFASNPLFQFHCVDIRDEAALLEILRRQNARGQASGLDVANQESALAQAEATLPPLEKQLAPTGSIEKLLPGSREAKLWAHYAKRYRQIVQDLEGDLDALLARAFQQAYEAHLAELTRARLRGTAQTD